MPEREVRIPFRNSSRVYRDGCFDMTRSFGPQRQSALTEELFERNRHLPGPDDDFRVGQRLGRGVKAVPGDNLEHHGPNVVLECAPLPLSQRAKLFEQGVKVMVPSHRRTR